MKSQFSIPKKFVSEMLRQGEFSVDTQIVELQLKSGQKHNALVYHGDSVVAIEGVPHDEDPEFTPDDIVDVVVTNKRWWSGALFVDGIKR